MVVGPDPDEVTRREEMEQHLRDEMARWSQVGNVLEPHTTYRLKVVTNIKAEGEGELAGYSRRPRSDRVRLLPHRGTARPDDPVRTRSVTPIRTSLRAAWMT